MLIAPHAVRLLRSDIDVGFNASGPWLAIQAPCRKFDSAYVPERPRKAQSERYRSPLTNAQRGNGDIKY